MLTKFVPATLIGSGKVSDIKQMVENAKANVVVIDHQLTGVQTRNLEEALGCRVLDRAQVILDIFAQRAQTYEGKLQVELAQMLDQLPRMVDAWLGSLSRQGGGIGTRGPGETALEMDRRRIRNRIKLIKEKLKSVQKKRMQHRSERKKNKVPSFALIGYTNSGKSTLLNKLTQSQVFAKDLLFATLDPTTRKVHLGDAHKAVLTDTVGFIRKLPHHLIEAFKATLEESAEADILIQVIDLSSPQMENHIKVVEELMQEFSWQNKPMIFIYNKVDIAPFARRFKVKQSPRVFLSAETGEGIGELKKIMCELIDQMTIPLELFFPREVEHKIYELQRDVSLMEKEEGPQGTLCKVRMVSALVNKWKEYSTHELQLEKITDY